jgi:hypothetical protein
MASVGGSDSGSEEARVRLGPDAEDHAAALGEGDGRGLLPAAESRGHVHARVRGRGGAPRPLLRVVSRCVTVCHVTEQPSLLVVSRRVCPVSCVRACVSECACVRESDTHVRCRTAADQRISSFQLVNDGCKSACVSNLRALSRIRSGTVTHQLLCARALCPSGGEATTVCVSRI